MPYGRRYQRKSTRRPKRAYRKRAGVTVKKTTKVPVVSAYRFAKLEKRVRMNSSKMWGPVQCNYQLTGASLAVDSLHPILFDASDFSAFQSSVSGTTSIGARIYSLDSATPPNVTTPSNWTRQDFVDNPYWNSQNLDTVDGGAYKPLMSKITLRIAGVPTISNCRVRIDHFKAKRGAFLAANLTGFTLFPSALQYHQNMATPTLNKFSPQYIKLIKTRWVTLNSSHFEGEGHPGDDPEDAPPQGTTVNFKYVSIYLKRRKPVSQVITRPTIPPTTTSTGVSFIPNQNELTDGNYGPLNRVPQDCDWIMVSCNDSTNTLQSVSVTGSRYCKWRDKLGKASIL